MSKESAKQLKALEKSQPGIRKKLMSLQNNKCAICEDLAPFCLDHDHENNEIRGVLCARCNHLLGNARDSVTILRAAVRYLNWPVTRRL